MPISRTLDAIASRLMTSGLGLVQGKTIFIGSDTNIPTSGRPPIITIIEPPGRPNIGVHNASPLRQPAPQVTVRGDLYLEVSELAEKTYEALGGGDIRKHIVNTTIAGVFFLNLHPQQDIFQLPNDVQGRIRLAFNLFVVRR